MANLRTPVNFSSPYDATSLIAHLGGATVTPAACAVITPAAAFDPASVSGLKAWYGADRITGIADGSALSTWKDGSSNLNDATQALGALQPIYRQGIVSLRPAVLFSVHRLTAPDAPTLNLAGPVTIMAVARGTGSGGALVKGTTAIHYNYGMILAGGSLTARYNNADRIGPAISATDFQLWEIELATTSTKFWVNGTLTSQTGQTNTLQQGTEVLRIGDDSINKLTGQIAELVLYGGSLASVDQLKLRGYFAQKYGLTIAGGTTPVALPIGITSTNASLAGLAGYEGILFRASTGMTASQLEHADGSKPANMEADLFLVAAGITEADVLAGVWRHAAASVFITNYEALNMGQLVMQSGFIGQFVQRGSMLVAEIRSYSGALVAQIGTVTRPECDADFGDARCGLDLNALGFVKTGSLTGVTSQTVFADSARTEAAGFFQNGKIAFTSGPNNNLGTFQIDAWDATTKTFTLRVPLPYAPTTGDAYTATRGCRKRFAEDCVALFSNGLNFRGAPHIDTVESLIKLPTI